MDSTSHSTTFLYLFLLCFNILTRIIVTAHPRFNRAQKDIESEQSSWKLARDVDIEEAEELLPTEYDINLPDSNGKTALDYAIESERKDVVRLLLENGANVTLFDRSTHRTPLHKVVNRGNLELVKLFLEFDPDIDARDIAGRSPLHNAAGNGNEEIVHFLLQHQTDVNASDNARNTPLHLAINYKHELVAELLINADSGLDVANIIGQTPLHRAVATNQLQISKALLEKGANISTKDLQGNTPLSLAIKKNFTKEVETMMKYCPESDQDDTEESLKLLHVTRGKSSWNFTFATEVRNVDPCSGTIKNSSKLMALVEFSRSVLESPITETLIQEPPRPPLLLSPDETIGGCRNGKINMTWIAGSNYGNQPSMGYNFYHSMMRQNNKIINSSNHPARNTSIYSVEVHLKPWSNNEFWVIALNVAGLSPSSKIVQCHIPPEIPSMHPTQILISRTLQDSVFISWDPIPEKYQNGPGFKYVVSWRKTYHGSNADEIVKRAEFKSDNLSYTEINGQRQVRDDLFQASIEENGDIDDSKEEDMESSGEDFGIQWNEEEVLDANELTLAHISSRDSYYFKVEAWNDIGPSNLPFEIKHLPPITLDKNLTRVTQDMEKVTEIQYGSFTMQSGVVTSNFDELKHMDDFKTSMGQDSTQLKASILDIPQKTSNTSIDGTAFNLNIQTIGTSPNITEDHFSMQSRVKNGNFDEIKLVDNFQTSVGQISGELETMVPDKLQTTTKTGIDRMDINLNLSNTGRSPNITAEDFKMQSRMNDSNFDEIKQVDNSQTSGGQDSTQLETTILDTLQTTKTRIDGMDINLNIQNTGTPPNIAADDFGMQARKNNSNFNEIKQKDNSQSLEGQETTQLQTTILDTLQTTTKTRIDGMDINLNIQNTGTPPNITADDFRMQARKNNSNFDEIKQKDNSQSSVDLETTQLQTTIIDTLQTATKTRIDEMDINLNIQNTGTPPNIAAEDFGMQARENKRNFDEINQKDNSQSSVGQETTQLQTTILDTFQTTTKTRIDEMDINLNIQDNGTPPNITVDDLTMQFKENNNNFGEIKQTDNSQTSGGQNSTQLGATEIGIDGIDINLSIENIGKPPNIISEFFDKTVSKEDDKRTHTLQEHDSLKERCAKIEKNFQGKSYKHTWFLKSVPVETFLKIPCPSNLFGSAIWQCLHDGKWDSMPDISNCSHELFHTSNKDGWMSNNVTAAEIVSEKAQNMSTVQISPGDIQSIGNFIHVIYSKHEKDLNHASNDEDRRQLAEKYFNATVRATNYLVEHDDAWQDLQEDKRPIILTQIQLGVTRAAEKYADYLHNEKKIIRYDTVSMEVISRPAGCFGDEPLSFKHPNYNHTKITLPAKLYEHGETIDGPLKVLFVAFDNLDCISNTISCNQDATEIPNTFPALAQINSPIIGAKVGDTKTWKAPDKQNVVVELEHIYNGKNYELGNTTCVWWDNSRNTWNTLGCILKESNDLYSICHCNHLTNFAIIMDVYGQLDKTTVAYFTMRLITIIGCSVSLFSLLLCILCFLSLKKMREGNGSKRNFPRINMCICLFFAELIMLTGMDFTENELFCKFTAFGLHYFFLATFTWSAIESYHLYKSFYRILDTGGSRKKVLLVVGYLGPLLLATITFAVSRDRYGTYERCWLDPQTCIWAFIAVLVPILMVNLFIFVYVMTKTWGKSNTFKKSAISRTCGSFTIFLFLGLNWWLGFLYSAGGSNAVAISFTVFNSLQGVTMFIFSILLDNSILEHKNNPSVKNGRNRQMHAVYHLNRNHSQSRDIGAIGVTRPIQSSNCESSDVNPNFNPRLEESFQITSPPYENSRIQSQQKINNEKKYSSREVFMNANNIRSNDRLQNQMTAVTDSHKSYLEDEPEIFIHENNRFYQCRKDSLKKTLSKCSSNTNSNHSMYSEKQNGTEEVLLSPSQLTQSFCKQNIHDHWSPYRIKNEDDHVLCNGWPATTFRTLNISRRSNRKVLG